VWVGEHRLFDRKGELESGRIMLHGVRGLVIGYSSRVFGFAHGMQLRCPSHVDARRIMTNISLHDQVFMQGLPVFGRNRAGHIQ
jgi:hypothetical protein